MQTLSKIALFFYLYQICDIKHMCAKPLSTRGVLLVYFTCDMGLSTQINMELFQESRPLFPSCLCD